MRLVIKEIVKARKQNEDEMISLTDIKELRMKYMQEEETNVNKEVVTQTQTQTQEDRESSHGDDEKHIDSKSRDNHPDMKKSSTQISNSGQGGQVA